MSEPKPEAGEKQRAKVLTPKISNRRDWGYISNRQLRTIRATQKYDKRQNIYLKKSLKVIDGEQCETIRHRQSEINKVRVGLVIVKVELSQEG